MRIRLGPFSPSGLMERVGASVAARTVLAAAILGVLGIGALAAENRPSGSLERPFVPQGRIRMDLAAGEHRILGDADNRVRMEWTVRDAQSLAKVKARADVQGKDLSITTDGPRNRGLNVTILLPRESDLHVRLTAGELRVENIRGNKDIELHAGDARIDVGRADDYSAVDASVWVADLRAAPFQVFKDGLFRSFDWKGKGPYRLHAHLKAGDLRLYSKDGDSEKR